MVGKYNGDIKAKMSDYLICFCSVLLLFSIAFYFVDSIVDSLPKNKVAFGWEKKIPFYEAAFIPYYGIFILPVFIPFLVKERRKLYTLTLRLLFSIIVAGIIFRFFPCELIYPPRDIARELEIFTVLIAGKYNLIPSLHVCLTYIICLSLFTECQRFGKSVILIVIIILPLSTLFSHQHHIVDVLTGIGLAVFSFKLIK